MIDQNTIWHRWTEALKALSVEWQT